MKPIPVDAARAIAQDFDYDQVIIIGRKVGTGPETGEHMTTYGTTDRHKQAAALIGNYLKIEIMGWPVAFPAKPQGGS